MPVARTLSTLVVDDHLTMRALVRNGLQQLGFSEIVEADNGEQGLRLLLNHSPSPKLIISDYNMPKVDGLRHRSQAVQLYKVLCASPTSTHAYPRLPTSGTPTCKSQERDGGN